MVYYYLFGVLVNYYFQVSFDSKVILYAVKIAQNVGNATALLQGTRLLIEWPLVD